MAKYGYTCACGWQLKRGKITRKEYASKKFFHAYKDNDDSRGIEVTQTEFGPEVKLGCRFLREELKISQAVVSY